MALPCPTPTFPLTAAREGAKVHVALVGPSCLVKGGCAGAGSAEPSAVLETV